MKLHDILATLVIAIADMGSGEDSDTDNDILQTSAYMVKQKTSIDVLPDIDNDLEVRLQTHIDPPSDVIDVKAHFEYRDNPNFKDVIYAISDGGADSCILGMNAKILSYTGRYANLVGYDPNTTRTEKVPIVTALIKVKSSSNEQHPILLKVHEAPYNPLSPITLLSEYQRREQGLVTDSVAKKHLASKGTYGTKSFHVSALVHINFEDRRGLMGFEMLPIEPEDEERFDMFTITGPEKWRPSKFVKQNDSDILYYDPSDSIEVKANEGYPAILNHLCNIDINDQNDFDNDHSHNDPFDILSMTQPIIESHILATATWHKVIHKDIPPSLLRPYFGWRPEPVVKKTLERATQMARMILRKQMRRHKKARFPHMNVFRIDEPVSTDPLFTNCRSMYHGYTAAQVFFETKSHTIFIYGIKSKGEFPRVYRDFIRCPIYYEEG